MLQRQAGRSSWVTALEGCDGSEAKDMVHDGSPTEGTERTQSATMVRPSQRYTNVGGPSQREKILGADVAYWRTVKTK